MENVNINDTVPTPRQSIQITEEEPVGFEDDAESIIHLLTRGTKDLDIISIVGMPGLGKTTLATKVFKDSSIISHFDVRAWRTISQSYDVSELLRDIYRQVDARYSDVSPSDDIADMLRKCLIGKRYLIVLDDIWEVKVYEKLQLSFPNGKNGSRIILTSRLKKVAEEVMLYSDPYSLRFLTSKESWKLLQKKAFQNEICPTELQDVGLKVAQYCRGLPLTIVLIGGILAKKEKNVSEWCEFACNLKSHFGSIENESDLAIELSYRHLPNHLKHCLLTMATFLEDVSIQASGLMLLWRYDELVQCSDESRLEEVLEGYLMDLISSNLIMVSKTTYDGKVKYLKIHDLVHDYCYKKAKEEKFMHVLGSHNRYEPSYDGEHRVCIHLHDKRLSDLPSIDESLLTFLTRNSRNETSAQQLRSLFVTRYKSDSCSNHHFLSLGSLSHLRVLDFKPLYLKNYQNVLQSLVHLRYIRICCNKFSFELVSHLCHLETLLVSSESLIIATPHIWNVTKLRHLHVPVRFSLEVAVSEEELPSKLENLRTFHGIIIDVNEDMEVIFERFPNLQELYLFVDSDGDDEPDFLFLKLEVLTHLQSLHLHMLIRLPITNYFFPSSLKVLILQNAHLSTGAASTIAVLPNLGKLKFLDCEFEKKEWDVRDVEFPALKVLKIRKVTLMQWYVLESSFPVLEVLVLKDIRKLEKIPYSFADVQTLKLIKVIYAQDSVNASASDIKEEVESIAGCATLEVHISQPYSRSMVEELTDDQISAFKEGFSHFDKKGDGCISTKELGTVMQSLGQYPTNVELQAMIDGVDAAGNGTIYFPEFINLMSRWIKDNGADKHEELPGLFDKDQNGFISADGIRHALESMGMKMTDEEIDEIFREADLDGDGKIYYEEFIKFVKDQANM